MTARAPSRLPLYLAGCYTLLALYGSLYPFVGWRVSGIALLDFLDSGWPRYFTGFDVVVNALAYVPLGFLWVAALQRRLSPVAAAVVSAFSCLAFSLGIEAAQNFLPSRVPSNLDLVSNALGGLVGALAGLRWGVALLDGGRLHDWRERRFLAGTTGDHGLLLLGLWFFTQLNPETFLFGSGNLRSWFDLPAAIDFEAIRFTELEMATVAAQTFAIALIASRMAVNHPWLLPLACIGGALAVKSIALMVLMQSPHGFAWATPGTLAGLLSGLGAWAAAMQLATGPRQALAALALMLATVLANLMPDNPYLENTLRVWQQGHFLNFNGLTRLATSLWPYLALLWLMLARSEK